jgi:hypothetical protein
MKPERVSERELGWLLRRTAFKSPQQLAQGALLVAVAGAFSLADK